MVMAMGKSSVADGPPTIPSISGLPHIANKDLNSPFLAPFKHFSDHPFLGQYDPASPNDLLNEHNLDVQVERTTSLTIDTENVTGGIANTPFITRQADVTRVEAIFWIMECKGAAARLQYTQTVHLALPAADGTPITFPHVSVNTLEKYG